MALREDLISSAISFLQEPSVANAPLDKRIAFLQSKNLTQQEIDAAIARSGQSPSSQTSYTSPALPPRPPQPQYGYNPYQNGYWEQPPPELPRRDWRDYFIMATVMGGVSYGLYVLAKRYVVPLVAPPTPPQLEQDKAAIDEAFTRAFDLIEQLSADTAAIKASESQRQERLDSALSEMEEAIQDLKISSRRREDDNHRIADDVKALQGLIPKAMKAQEESNDARLRELSTELRSLKTLVANRMGGGGNPAPPPPAKQADINGVNMFGTQGTVGTGVSTNAMSDGTSTSKAETATPPTTTPAARSSTSSPYPSYAQYPGSRGGIPAWQLAASKKADTPATPPKDEQEATT